MIETSWSIEACAKVNLRLVVLAREESGYHSLETLYCGISLSDRIIARSTSSRDVELVVEGEVDTGPLEENLVLRAAQHFFDDAGVPGGVHLTLDKGIPSQAGLGGGSSDAAATLRLLNAATGHPLSEGRLLQIGARLGSDVPFFMTPSPLALAWSRGERILQLEPLPPKTVLVAHPGRGIPTAAAFSRLAEMRGPERPIDADFIPAAQLTSWDGVAQLARNDFEFVAFERIPQLVHAVRTMVDAGASPAMLAGSGAAVFGIFDDAEAADEARNRLTRAGLETWTAETLSAWPQPVPGIDPAIGNR